MTDISLPLTFDPDSLDPETAELLPRLASADAAVRRIALLALADLEDAAVLGPIVAALRTDVSSDVRAQAAEVLGAWERADAVEALCEALADDAENVRDAAAQSLSNLKDPESGPLLAPWTTHCDPFVRQAALRGLRELRYAGALEPALTALTASEDVVRLEAVSVLGWLKSEQALGPLAALAAQDPNAAVRRAAIGALGIGAAATEGTIAALLGALRDAAWQVREEAVTTLGKLRVQTARDALIAMLDDDYWQVRLQAVRALGKLGDATASAPVAALLTHAISNLRKEAALSLGELGDAASLPALQAAATDPDPEVRKAARIALTQIETAQ
ncbi:HEAT repeat domain-containing protein [Paraburkholderia sp. 1N]|uniref:HEAT repeat domain-containing protein n=1 Tax=Paraburkholderia solitsugae TaxID=2675748 RepID=A0ABX2C4A3_9BURK|nr:HEAT repeat domain-containing protein [Paraburkholderia solitsugae]NPT47236.1 HEAT repeat domain-containing protein [Paraburkholderia solitsugae]